MSTKKPNKSSGDIGPTKVIGELDGSQTVELIKVPLPSDKEGLERFFAEHFVAYSNQTISLGPDLIINDLTQNTTSDLDFSIKSKAADYLELAELNPRSEEFGRTTYRTGKYNIYEYARWIWLRIIRKKERSYGEVARRTILVLYSTHWQFQPSERTIECLNSIAQLEGCEFSAVVAFYTNGTDFNLIRIISPVSKPIQHHPKEYSGFTCRNLEPGRNSWDLGPQPPNTERRHTYWMKQEQKS